MENIRPKGYELENELNDSAMSYHEMEYLMNKGKVNISENYIGLMNGSSIKSPFESAYQNELKAKINEILSTLHPREEEVVRYRHNMKELGAEPTFENIGEKIGVTGCRVRQIYVKAMRKLKHPSRIKGLKRLLE